jgi:hypothetical protein
MYGRARLKSIEAQREGVGLAGATERDALGRPFQMHWTARMREEYYEQMAEREPRRRAG